MSTKICVAGASGLVGSNIVKACLAKGYDVVGTLRDKDDPDAAPYLMALPGAAERLRLVSADMSEPGAFDAACAGADCVFIACLVPTYVGASGVRATEMDDEQGYAEIIMPTVTGCLNIMASASKGGASTVVIGSSTSSTNPEPAPAVKNEIDHWSDVEVQCRDKKYTSATKTVMEKAAIEFAQDNGLRLAIMLPTLMLGPVILPKQGKGGFHGLVRNLVAGGAAPHKQVPAGSMSMIHIDDLANLFLAAYENPQAEGRYFGIRESWPWQDIYAELARLIPEATMPAPLDGDPETPTQFDFTRRDSLGVTVRDIPEVLADTVAWARREG